MEEVNLWKLPKEMLIKIILQTGDFDKYTFEECKKMGKKLEKVMRDKKNKAIRKGLYNRLTQLYNLEEIRALDDTMLIDIKDFINVISIDKSILVYEDTNGYKYFFNSYDDFYNECDMISQQDIAEDPHIKSIYNNFCSIQNLLEDKDFRKAFISFYLSGEENEYFSFQ